MPNIPPHPLRALSALLLVIFALFAAQPALAQRSAKLQEYLDKAEAISARHGMVLGNPRGTLTVYKFFDYNCPYCRAAVPFMERMMKQYPQLKLVVIDDPSLGQDSVEVAIAMAQIPAAKRHKAHLAALGPGKRNAAWVAAYAKSIGVTLAPWDATDNPQVRQIRTDIGFNRSLARAIGFNGVPGFVVGNQYFNGFDEQAIAKAICQESGRKNCG
ncbi:MAG: thioredoxin domain-containing protein [Sphingomonadales bacterium]|nr:thioredoxin domain-containing protein [Sphingomonadales bacterium]MBD3773081.1 thioredoxin domain-containing protein [Paracoccaceae bacterium]